MKDSLWFTTRSALFKGGGDAWRAIAAYSGPLGRLLGRRYAWLSTADREDLVQDVLIEMKQTLAARHDAKRGKFRALLQTVIKRRVADFVRKKRPASLEPGLVEDVALPPEEEIEALDIEASLVEAMGSCRDHFTQGPTSDPDVLYALADRVVHGLSNAEIARQGAVSVDRVARLLRRGRAVLYKALLADQLELEPSDERFGQLVSVFRGSLQKPGDTQSLVETIKDADLRARLEAFLARFRAGLREFASRPGGTGEFQRGVGLVLEADEAQ